MRIVSMIEASALRGATGAAVVLALSACGNMSGLDGTSEFSCKAPKGVHCESVSGNYHNRDTQSGPIATLRGAAAPAGGSEVPQVMGAAPRGMDPALLRAPARVLRLWVKAWQDSDRDLVDQSYIYVRVDDGNWQLAHVQQTARDAYPSPRPPATATPSAVASAESHLAGAGGEGQAAPGAVEQAMLPGVHPAPIPAR